MNKAKAILVTAVMALMLALILVGLYLLQPTAHRAVATLLAVYGFIVGAGNLCGWLQKEEQEPQHLSESEDPFAHDDESADYVRIFDEIRRGGKTYGESTDTEN